MLAGFSIGIACILYLLCPNQIIGAIIFGLGLLNVRLMRYGLYTGKVQNVITYSDGTVKTVFLDTLTLLGFFLLNLAGIFLSYVIGSWIPGVTERARDIAEAKLSLGFMELFGKAFLCGYLMTIATRPSTPLWIASLCVFTFVYLGLNHCVADSFYYMAIPQKKPLIHLMITVAGNYFGGLAAAITRPGLPPEQDSKS